MITFFHRYILWISTNSRIYSINIDNRTINHQPHPLEFDATRTQDVLFV